MPSQLPLKRGCQLHRGTWFGLKPSSSRFRLLALGVLGPLLLILWLRLLLRHSTYGGREMIMFAWVAHRIYLVQLLGLNTSPVASLALLTLSCTFLDVIEVTYALHISQAFRALLPFSLSFG